MIFRSKRSPQPLLPLGLDASELPDKIMFFRIINAGSYFAEHQSKQKTEGGSRNTEWFIILVHMGVFFPVHCLIGYGTFLP